MYTTTRVVGFSSFSIILKWCACSI